jgi:hypothetical protein
MIDTLIIFQPTPPWENYSEEYDPECPACSSLDVAIVDKGRKYFCRDCKYKGNPDEF